MSKIELTYDKVKEILREKLEQRVQLNKEIDEWEKLFNTLWGEKNK